ncbi:siderophore-interacting protein [Demequina sp. TTPB684]|uniref:siderophore-interacting protein n=1 Tax=unclassified Demequina TaxID=2620311 RepID=UPI001CF41D91|nr:MULTISPECIES: siderophore-interacting protein [unclassified Demequina]MCB2412243.1 siderophore-interacting protein [Demequina sp. TTPB684]UPU87775.1 siderophore-interacting protein [Demequina sp. TMPB413]
METTIDAVVTSLARITPGFVRVGLQVCGDGAWSSLGVPDEFVHIEVGAHTPDADGHTARHYTISAVTPEGFELEVAIHGHGQGSAWAESLTVGDAVKVSEPKAYYAAPAARVPRVLVGDATALPAIARILAEASKDERFVVVVELASLEDARSLPTAADASVEWVVGGNGVSASTIVDATAREVRAATASTALAGDVPGVEHGDEPPVYVWVACESSVSRQVRTVLRRELGLPARALRIVGYWHADIQRLLDVWAKLTEEQRAQYDEIWSEDRSDEENWEILEPYMKALGL